MKETALFRFCPHGPELGAVVMKHLISTHYVKSFHSFIAQCCGGGGSGQASALGSAGRWEDQTHLRASQSLVSTGESQTLNIRHAGKTEVRGRGCVRRAVRELWEEALFEAVALRRLLRGGDV